VWAQETAPAPVPTTTPAPTVEEKPFNRIFIVGEMTLVGFQWTDLGLEKETQFTAPLTRAWEKWFKENLPKTVSTVEICEATCLTYLEGWEEKSPEELVNVSDTYFQNVLWLRVGITLRRNVINNRQTFSWDGRVLLLDGNTKRSLANLTLSREQKEWMNIPQKEVNTQLVSRVYRTPIGVFPRVVEKAETSLPLNRVIKLVISGYKHMGDVTAYSELLQSRGSSLGLQVAMSGFGSKEAVMKVYFRGEEKSFTDLLSQVKELKSSYNYSLVNEITADGIVVRMVKQ
jgi:hypothetical protein